MHPKRCLVRPYDGLVGIYQDYAFAQAADNVPETIEIDGGLNIGHAWIPIELNKPAKPPANKPHFPEWNVEIVGAHAPVQLSGRTAFGDRNLGDNRQKNVILRPASNGKEEV
ncbi:MULTISPECIES: hypothetical protein [unclassified Sphingobium]|uniref:hypothetical protein n=1 Tax=unclassified Sphingobium TaxID=2611147 RepID=UPI001A29FD4B|nr:MULTISPECIES: hypothetical protein [unclassified Sphingobium]MBG6120566.1 hypothetical protein [Sphingobium sp. JAI105]